MLEILQIFFQLIIFILFTFFPINKFTFSRFSPVYINSNINAFLINIVILLNTFLLFIKVAANPSLGWDALAFWLSKTNTFYLGKSYFEVPHPQYPQLGSYIWAFFW